MSESNLNGVRTRLIWPLLQAFLRITPVPLAMLAKEVIAKDQTETAIQLLEGAPEHIEVIRNEHYQDSVNARFDVYRSPEAKGNLPVVVWLHGGAFVGGSKDLLEGYFRRLAAEQIIVVGLEYPLAPEHHIPTPQLQVLEALDHLARNADRLGFDPNRLILGGNSAGAMISSQVAAILTNPGYARLYEVEPRQGGWTLRGLLLCCGPYTPDFYQRTPWGLRPLTRTFLWAYSGKRRFLRDPQFTGRMTMVDHVTPEFPPVFITVGNADPIELDSYALTEALTGVGVEVDSLFFERDHQPELEHEYLFEMDLAEAGTAFRRIVDFIHRKT